MNNKEIKLSKTRKESLDWFFTKSRYEKEELKEKYFANEYTTYDNRWGFHFTFGQIEEMYIKESK